MSEPIRLWKVPSLVHGEPRYSAEGPYPDVTQEQLDREGIVALLAFPADDPDTPARLAGPELRDVLARVEWAGSAFAMSGCDGIEVPACPECLGLDPQSWLTQGVNSSQLRSGELCLGHHPDCVLAAALARACGEVEP